MRHIFLLFLCLLLLPGSGNAQELRLDIRGVDDDLHHILETALVLPTAISNGEQLNRRWLKRYQKQLPELVKGTLEPYGYFYSQTNSQIVNEDSGNPTLQVEVQPGEPLRITGLELKLTGPGKNLPGLQQQLGKFPLKTGDVLRQDLYEQGKSVLQQAAVDMGFLAADFDQHQIEVNLAERRAEIRLQLESGRRYRFGQTIFEGSGTYPESFLRRYLSYQEGGYFSYSKLGQTRLNLQDADLFRTVDIRALTELKQQDRVPVQIDLQPSPRHRFRPGIGYGTDTGARVSLRYRNLNLLKRGHELHGDLLLAERKQSLTSTYVIPDTNRLDSQTLLRAGLDREETDTYTSRTLFSEAEYRRSFSKRLIGSIFVRLSQEYSDISDETTRSQMLLPGVRLAWKETDDPLAPSEGLQASLQLQGAQDSIISDTSLLQLSVQTALLRPLPRNLSLLLRLQGGTTWHNDPLRELPASLRYFAGGDRSVRGYRYQSLGPRNDDGEVVGGKHLLVFNFELEKRLSPKWGVAAFYDAGNAFDSLNDYELEQGAGLGIRRYTPIGSLRLDLARQLGNVDNKYRIHFSVGFGW